MDSLLIKEIDRLDNVKFWLQNIKKFPKFKDHEKEKLELAFKLVEDVANNYEYHDPYLENNLFWNIKTKGSKKAGKRKFERI